MKSFRWNATAAIKQTSAPSLSPIIGIRREIEAIVDHWYEGGLDTSRPVIDYFKVRTTDGRVYLLRYLSAFDTWTICV